MTNSSDFIAEVAGVILAGGASRRFGANKALVHLEGQPLIAHIAHLFSRLFSERLLVTNSPAEFEFLGWPTTCDRYRDAGPLAGIEAALRTISSPRAMIVGCDMPLLDERLLRHLCRFPPEWDVVLPWTCRGPEPLCAVYHRRIWPAVDQALRRQERRIGRLLAGLTVRRIGEAELLEVVSDLSSFYNVNCRQDLEEIHHRPEPIGP
ncbi:MAG: molybdenum cofactor guanylyltransferase [Deltaproteobacteria bacterium]|jgi:molybdopterin-guanine dinucleotide biosynthesis protein A